ncbi:MAG: hypothetical protein K8R88_06605 [Armatimonadetes bacterium]|nr:hypothetical protein [Armatimonadota bacterium]
MIIISPGWGTMMDDVLKISVFCFLSAVTVSFVNLMEARMGLMGEWDERDTTHVGIGARAVFKIQGRRNAATQG